MNLHTYSSIFVHISKKKKILYSHPIASLSFIIIFSKSEFV